MNPMLATNAVIEKLKFPLIAQPKIDGVRGWNPYGKLLGRSMEPHANVYTTKLFSGKEFTGLDGELCVGMPWADSACRTTTSRLSTIQGGGKITWHLFDFVNRTTFFLPYERRLEELQIYLQGGWSPSLEASRHSLAVIPHHLVRNLDEMYEAEASFLIHGYEGLILRDPMGVWRQGKCTAGSNALLRIKRFEDREGEILELYEGQINNNPPTYGANGKTKRSTHAENMEASGTIGSLAVRDLETGKVVTISKGKLTGNECLRYFQQPKLIIGRVCTYRIFPKGGVSKPRFPTFRNFRADSDMEKS